MSGIIDFYKQFSLFTFPGCYKEKLLRMPDDINQIGNLVRASVVHRTTLVAGNTGTNKDKKYGDMTKVPWWQQPQDDYLVTAGAMLTELYRKDERGFILNRKEEDKLILTCRFVSIMVASIFKTKGIPARVRSGFSPSFSDASGDDYSWDHWINQYWDKKKKRWVTVDVDGSWHDLDFDPYDLPEGKFDFAPTTYLGVRDGTLDENHFHNAGGFKGLYPVVWALIYDFHCLMNNETIYLHGTNHANVRNYGKDIKKKDLIKLDELASLMLKPDDNFEKLQEVWKTKKEFRLLRGALL